MNNETIIAKACADLGIKEEVHTFSIWKSMGFCVNRGEHAAFRATIWKHVAFESKDGNQQERIFPKTAAFFTRSQVSPIPNPT